MKLIENFKKLGLGIAELIFPIYCLVCGIDGKFLCENCFQTLERLPNQLCISCQKPVPFGKTHPDCSSKNKLDGIISALPYSNPKVANLIETYKYKFINELSPDFSNFILEAVTNQGLTGYFQDFIIMPVPLHKRRFAWRGFNQAELLARQLSKDLSIPADSDLVKRIKFTTPQTTLKKEKRLENIQNAFGVTKPVSGKYLLVDDVVTTGATLNEIAKQLKKSGATEVWAVTVAHG